MNTRKVFFNYNDYKGDLRMNINLKNGYIFPYDSNKKFVCYFGCNSVGKTVISNALDDEFTNQGKDVLHFSDYLLNEMIDVDDKTGNIQVFPKITEIKVLEIKKSSFTTKYSFSKMMKDIGLSSAPQRKLFPKIKQCEEQGGLAVDKTIGVYNKDELKDIFEAIKTKTKNSFYDLITNKELIGELKNADDINSIVNSNSATINDIRKKIINNDLLDCPVCFSPLSEVSLGKIKMAMNNVALEDNIKEELLLLLEKDINKTIFIDFIRNKDNTEGWLNVFKDNLDDSIIAYLYEEIGDDKAINEFRKTCNDLNVLNIEMRKYEIPNNPEEQNELDKRVHSLLKEHKVFRKAGITVQIKDGRLDMKGISYIDLSQSEKNFLKFLYFDILLMSKHNDSKKVELIIDDPFDSYDESTISNLLYIIRNSFESYSASINSTYIFSHSIRLVYLYQEVSKINCLFELKWIDKQLEDSTLQIFNDNGFLNNVDYSPSDYWIANYIINNSMDEYSLVCASIILREFAHEHQYICCPSNYVNDNNDFYKEISDKVVHLRDNSYTVLDLLNSLKKLYRFKNGVINLSSRIVDVMNNIDDNAFSVISLIVPSGPVPNDSIFKLFIVKYLISLRTRQLIQNYMVSKHNDLNKNTIGANIEIINNNHYSDMSDIVLFYEKNKLLLNEFAHSFTKSFSPFFTYCYEDLVNVYIEVKGIAIK